MSDLMVDKVYSQKLFVYEETELILSLRQMPVSILAEDSKTISLKPINLHDSLHFEFVSTFNMDDGTALIDLPGGVSVPKLGTTGLGIAQTSTELPGDASVPKLGATGLSIAQTSIDLPGGVSVPKLGTTGLGIAQTSMKLSRSISVPKLNLPQLTPAKKTAEVFSSLIQTKNLSQLGDLSSYLDQEVKC